MGTEVLLLLVGKGRLNEDLLELLVGVVDDALLKAVLLESLKPVEVQDPKGFVLPMGFYLIMERNIRNDDKGNLRDVVGCDFCQNSCFCILRPACAQSQVFSAEKRSWCSFASIFLLNLCKYLVLRPFS